MDISVVINGMQTKILELQEKVEQGDMEVLGALISLREFKAVSTGFIDLIKEVEASLEDEIISSISNHNGKYNGYEISYRGGRKTYSFKGIPAYDAKEKELKEIKEIHKNALIQFEKGIISMDQDQVVIDTYPTVSYGRGSILVSKSKK